MSAARTTIIAIVGIGCVAAAGIGGYVAQRSNADATEAAPARVAVQGQAELVPTPRVGPNVETTAPRSIEAPKSATLPAPQDQAPVERPVTLPAASSRSPKTSGSMSPSLESQGGSSEPVTMSASASSTAALPEPVAPPVQAEAAAVAPDRAKVQFDELTLKEEAVIGIRLETALSTDTARVEDRVSARVARDVTVDGRIAVPSGARLEGTVTMVERGGKFRERARLGVRFHAVVLSDNSRIPIQTETIYRDGDAPAPEASAKVGASAVIGGILGAVIGGKKGAAIGTAAGAVGGTAAVMASGPNDAALAAGTPLTVRLTSPVTILVSRDQ